MTLSLTTLPYAENCYPECHIKFNVMLNDIMPSAVMLIVVYALVIYSGKPEANHKNRLDYAKDFGNIQP